MNNIYNIKHFTSGILLLLLLACPPAFAKKQQKVYVVEKPAKQTLLHPHTPEGRLIQRTNGTYRYEYTLTDHLGNARVSFTDEDADGTPELLQEDHYYPFGMQMPGLHYAGGGTPENKYLYNGKELVDDEGINLYDYGFRFYDAALGRWHVIDEFAEKYYNISPYSYCFNNPVTFIDFLGLDPRYNWDERKYYDDETGETMSWNEVSSWMDENNAGSEIWNAETGFQLQNFENVESDMFSAAYGHESGIPFVEFGFGKQENRQYVTTFLVGKDDYSLALGKDSPLNEAGKLNLIKLKVHQTTAPWGETLAMLLLSEMGGIAVAGVFRGLSVSTKVANRAYVSLGSRGNRIINKTKDLAIKRASKIYSRSSPKTQMKLGRTGVPQSLRKIYNNKDIDVFFNPEVQQRSVKVLEAIIRNTTK